MGEIEVVAVTTVQPEAVENIEPRGVWGETKNASARSCKGES